MKTQIILPVIALVVIALGAVYYFSSLKPITLMESSTPEATSTPTPIPATGIVNVVLKTSKGDIALELYPDKAPETVANFVKLAKEGFYNGTKFHRVIPKFMIQAGDPNTKGSDVSSYGMGGPGYTIADEFTNGLKNDRGSIAMAHSSLPHSGGSQFYINVNNNSSLDGGYTVFGKVTSGMDVADAIVAVPRNAQDLPNEAITIASVEVK